MISFFFFENSAKTSISRNGLGYDSFCITFRIFSKEMHLIHVAMEQPQLRNAQHINIVLMVINPRENKAPFLLPKIEKLTTSLNLFVQSPLFLEILRGGLLHSKSMIL